MARVSAESLAAVGQTMELALDTTKLVVFDADSGVNLTDPGGASAGVTQVLDEVRAHLRDHFAAKGVDTEPDSASVTFLGVERIDVLRFGPTCDGELHYVSLGCSRHPMGDPAALAVDPLRGPRAEVVVRLRDSVPTPGLARTVAVLAATPAVDGVVLVADALIDWVRRCGSGPPGCRRSARCCSGPAGSPT